MMVCPRFESHQCQVDIEYNHDLCSSHVVAPKALTSPHVAISRALSTLTSSNHLPTLKLEPQPRSHGINPLWSLLQISKHEIFMANPRSMVVANQCHQMPLFSHKNAQGLPTDEHSI